MRCERSFQYLGSRTGNKCKLKNFDTKEFNQCFKMEIDITCACTFFVCMHNGSNIRQPAATYDVCI